jgi:hypothetical protein
VGQITGIERNPNVIYISGERLAVTAESRLFESLGKREDEQVITWQALTVGDYVLFERDGAVLKRLKRVSSDDIDLPGTGIVIGIRDSASK